MVPPKLGPVHVHDQSELLACRQRVAGHLKQPVKVNVAHLNAKFAAERMIEQADLPATILRPTYFAQNDTGLKGALVGGGIYPIALGQHGVSIVDARDVADADAAVIELLRREQAAAPCRERSTT
ncbi:MAG: NmrA family NAD(P)-binding protein [Acidimicrobiales bacterium]|jgi:uncharacterized protein YbjT (DUF2867 family)